MMMPSPSGIYFNSVPGIIPKNHVKCSGKNQAQAVPIKVHNQKRFTIRLIIERLSSLFGLLPRKVSI